MIELFVTQHFCATVMKTRQNTGTDQEGENDLALVPAGPAAMLAGNCHPFENLEQVDPTRSRDAQSDWPRLRRVDFDAAAFLSTKARDAPARSADGDRQVEVSQGEDPQRM